MLIFATSKEAMKIVAQRLALLVAEESDTTTPRSGGSGGR
jgi:hypothetical protein